MASFTALVNVYGRTIANMVSDAQQHASRMYPKPDSGPAPTVTVELLTIGLAEPDPADPQARQRYAAQARIVIVE